jgi:ATP-dependent helicase/nuclease subunit B
MRGSQSHLSSLTRNSRSGYNQRMAFQLDRGVSDALARGATLLTPNQRAARAIRRVFDSQMRAEGHTLWTPANVLPLQSWLAAEWHQRLLAGSESRILLNRTQEHVLWREIISTDPESRGSLRSPDALAELAARAWSLLCLYNGRGRLREFPLSTDSRAFERWSRAFERRLPRAEFITHAELPAALAASIDSTMSLALVDFDTQPPAIANLFSALETAGAAVERIRTDVASAASQFDADDDHSELVSAALWIRGVHEADPQARIAVVVPNLGDRRAEIERVFAPILSPDTLPITSTVSAPAFEFSLGRALAELPIATPAVDLLTWPLGPLPLERISALLLSPWFGHAEAPVAEFDAFELRQTNLLRPELSLEAMIRMVGGSRRASRLDNLIHRLRSLHKAARASHLIERPAQSEPLRQTHTEWADAFRAVLDAAGWTRQSRFDSLSFQQHRRFDAALDELATLDFDSNRSTAQETLNALTRILQQTVFAPESTDAPIQILGPLELGGVAFDHLWFLGADDLAWPATPAPSPLLSWQLQRALALSGADRGRDDGQALALTQRISRSAKEVVFSFARRTEEGERRRSPLITSLNLESLIARKPIAPVEPLTFDTVPDDVTLPPLPEGTIRGGAGILKLQAACAFRAFAEKRLWSTGLDTREPGLNALENGSIVHTVMQFFWAELKSQAALRSLTSSERSMLLDRAIDSALEDTRPDTRWDTTYLQLQRRRLHALLAPWLELELNRADFIVQSPEQSRPMQLGPLPLSLRIDRIDETASGLVVIDYKTGLSKPASWNGERPDEPQLPLYAVLAQESGEQLAGVAFAMLRAGKALGLKGYAEDSAILGAKPSAMEAPSLREQVDGWRDIVTALAAAFAAGDTRVAPKAYPKTCEHCGQRVLCRLNPETVDVYEEEESETEGEPAYG